MILNIILKMNGQKTLQVKLTEDQLEELRILAKKLGYSNTSEMIRRELLFIKHGEVKNAELTN